MKEKSTSQLIHLLEHTKPESSEAVFDKHSESFLSTDRPFSDYFRRIIKGKNIMMQDVFLKADIPERYGYKLVSGEKHTRQRDYILRMCIAAGFSTKETQHALNLYGMSELYPRIPRDAVIIIALNQAAGSVEAANELLIKHELEPLAGCRSTED